MNILDVYNFTPGPANTGKIEIPGQYPLHRFALIQNVTRGIVMYDPTTYRTNAEWDYDSLSNETKLTLETGTAFMDQDDDIQILVYGPEGTTSGPSSNVSVINFPVSQTINGSVSIIGEVEVANDLNNPLPVTGDVNVLNEVEVKNDLNNPLTITGTVTVDSSQTLPVTVSYPPGSTAGFGENLVAEITPVAQLEAIYGLGGDMASEYETFVSPFGGFAGTEDSTFVVSSSTAQYSYGVLRSNRFLRYRPGQSATGRFTAMFTTGVTGTEQRAGLFNQESAFMVGYKDGDFGVLHSYGANAAVATLEITTPPSSTADAVVILNGVSYLVPLVSGESGAETAARIANFPFPGWNRQQVDNRVTFVSTDTQPKPSPFSFTHATAVGALTLDRQGVVPNDVWIPQTSWNIDTLTGAGPSGMILDPTKLNVFQIRYKWLGVGSVSFMIEDQTSGKNIEFHKLIWTNQNTVPHVANPSMKIGYVAYNLGTSGSQVEVRGSSMMLGVDGRKVVNHFPRATAVTKSGLSNDNVDPDDIHHVITILNPLVVNGKINTRELILNNASLSAVASDPTNFLIYLDADFIGGSTNVFRSLPETNVVVCTVDAEVDGTLYTPLIISSVVGGGQAGGQKDVDFTPYGLILPAGSKLSICARSSTNITELSAAVTWTLD